MCANQTWMIQAAISTDELEAQRSALCTTKEFQLSATALHAAYDPRVLHNVAACSV
jgi:hypothetical protein